MTTPRMPPADVAVIVVNYGTADLALRAVGSVLARGHGGRRVEVHLVDNASPGGDAARLAAAHAAAGWGDRVTLYPETVNHGFGRANNLVLAALAARGAAPELVFLLNPDACLKTEAIAELAAFLEAHPGAAAVGAGIDAPGGGPAVTSAFRFPSPVSEFAGAARFGPLDRLTARWAVPLPPGPATRQVGWVAGAAVMLRRRALAEAGGFDPGFFLYFEEVELMHRLRRAGWSIWYHPAARVEHVAGAATGLRSGEERPRRLPAYWFDSWRLYFTRTRGRAGALACGLACLAGAHLHLLLSRLRGRPPAHPQGFAGDFARLALRPLLRGERR
ncbi:MAG TPA: glycosyltransferase [Paracoccaceae bacterium]|nr:glycosyltransferase [Paracoccaceae bacterium]HMO70036.1 glycosyltransferase [Paracoccaceae bacterium]